MLPNDIGQREIGDNPYGGFAAGPEDPHRPGWRLVHPPPDSDWESEQDFQRRIIALANAHGWLVYHTYDSRRSEPGFPDLVMARDRLIFAEVKTAFGRATREQTFWLQRLAEAGAEAYLWRPSDWDDICAILTRQRPGVVWTHTPG